MALTCGAVCRNISAVALCGPYNVSYKLVEEFIGTAEYSGLLDIGVHCDAGELIRIHRELCLNQHILISEDSELGLVAVSAGLAYILDLLQR